MGKRPYYVLEHTVDYDGYNSYLDYVGYNLEAALARFDFLYRDLRRQYYEDEGVNNINGTYPEINKDGLKLPGACITAYLNDDDQCWINLTLRSVNTGEFLRSDGDWRQERSREVRYKQEYPNAKYQDAWSDSSVGRAQD